MILVGKRLHAQTSFHGNCVQFFLADYDREGNQLLAAKIEFEPLTQGLMAAPSFSIGLDQAQEFFEELWAQGFRSKHDMGGAKQLDAARQEHIADLRKAAKLK